MSNKTKLITLNIMREQAGMKPLASWKSSGAALDAAIVKMAATTGTEIKAGTTEHTAIVTVPVTAKDQGKPSKTKGKIKPAAAKPKADAKARDSFASVLREAIAEGLDNKAAWARVMEKYPDTDPSKKWYAGWYRAYDKRTKA
jgi:hypothetical protein